MEKVEFFVLHTLRVECVCFAAALAALEHVPSAQRLVPRAAGQQRLGDRGREGTCAYGTLVSAQRLHEMARLHGPHEYVEDVGAAGRHQLATRIECQARELHRLRSGHGAKVAISVEIEGAHGAVQRARAHDLAVAFEVQARYGRVVLAKRHEALAVGRVPHLDLAVLAARRDIQARRRVGESCHVVEVTLLLEHVRLRLPLPHEELAELLARQADPVAGRIEDTRGDGMLGDAQRVDQIELGQLVEEERAVGKAADEYSGGFVEVAAGEADRHTGLQCVSNAEPFV